MDIRRRGVPLGEAVKTSADLMMWPSRYNRAEPDPEEPKGR